MTGTESECCCCQRRPTPTLSFVSTANNGGAVETTPSGFRSPDAYQPHIRTVKHARGLANLFQDTTDMKVGYPVENSEVHRSLVVIDKLVLSSTVHNPGGRSWSLRLNLPGMFEENYPGSPSPEAAVQEMIATEEPEKYPEGGKDAWLVVAGAWCAMIPSMGLLNTLAVLQAWVTEYELQGLPESTIGWVFSTYAFFLYFCGAQVGPIFDAHDVRYLVVPGCIGIVAAIMLMSLCKEFYQFFLTFGVLGGMSASLLFNPSISAIGHWFSERRALATGIACTAGGVGGVVFPLIILYLAPRVGFAWALRTVGFICLAVSVLACLLLKKRLPPNKKAGAAIDITALRDAKFALTTLAVFLIEFAVFIPYTYICSYAIHEGMGLQKSLLLNALLNAGAIPGRALPGYVADRFGPFNVMCVTALVCSTFIFALWMTAQGGEAATTAFAILFGFWSGAAISLTPVCIGRVCETKDYGKRSGTAFSISSIAALVGVPFAGAILQWCDGAYYGVIIFAGGLYVLALVAFIIARGVAGGWAFTVLY